MEIQDKHSPPATSVREVTREVDRRHRVQS